MTCLLHRNGKPGNRLKIIHYVQTGQPTQNCTKLHKIWNQLPVGLFCVRFLQKWGHQNAYNGLWKQRKIIAMTSLCKMQPFFLEKYYAIFSWSEYFFFLKEPVFARGVQCLKTYWLWVVQKASNFQGRRNRGAEGHCFSPLLGLADQLTLSQSGRGSDYAHQIIIKNLLVMGCAKSVKFSGP